MDDTITKGRCECCQKENVYVAETSFLGPYCKDCMELCLWEIEQILDKFNEFENERN